MTTWRNWSRAVTAHPAEIISPADEAEVAAVIGRAATAGQRVRAVGAGHSFTPIAATDGVILRLDRLTGLRSAAAETGLVTLGAGTRLHDVPEMLRPYGLAMETLGDIDAQTIAGAISTGTHGSSATFAGMPSQVRGLRIVLADGSVVACSAAVHPELFSLARLGLGAFGVITEVTLQCVPAFLIAVDERPVPLPEILETYLERSALSDHLEFFWFPHTPTALVKSSNRLDKDAAPERLSRWKSFVDDELLANGFFGVTCRLGARFPGMIPHVNKAVTEGTSARHYTDDSHVAFTTPRRVRFQELEFSIEPAAMPSAMAEIGRLIDDRGLKISFPVEVRMTAADDIPLSNSYGRQSVHVAVHQYWRESATEYFEGVEQILLAAGGRPHWAKVHTQTAQTLRGRYEKFDEATELRARVDPDGRFANPYVDRVLGPVPTAPPVALAVDAVGA
ncbi:L-gulonolactone oxidase [Nakamurella sp. UYEF19]|uniref:D-arabinono-1,4-lactone oxidase n=1 Tax=Nakamurella sp. UYEF19 TaxID=1756392 RepID=UPI003399D5E6